MITKKKTIQSSLCVECGFGYARPVCSAAAVRVYSQTSFEIDTFLSEVLSMHNCQLSSDNIYYSFSWILSK